MPRGVMVARRILVPPVRVRILPGQQKRMLLRVGSICLVMQELKPQIRCYRSIFVRNDKNVHVLNKNLYI